MAKNEATNLWSDEELAYAHQDLAEQRASFEWTFRYLVPNFADLTDLKGGHFLIILAENQAKIFGLRLCASARV